MRNDLRKVTHDGFLFFVNLVPRKIDLVLQTAQVLSLGPKCPSSLFYRDNCRGG